MNYRELWVRGLAVPILAAVVLLGVSLKMHGYLDEPKPALESALVATYGAAAVEKVQSDELKAKKKAKKAKKKAKSKKAKKKAGK